MLSFDSLAVDIQSRRQMRTTKKCKAIDWGFVNYFFKIPPRINAFRSRKKIFREVRICAKERNKTFVESKSSRCSRVSSKFV
jgi:hypothetical protein